MAAPITLSDLVTPDSVEDTEALELSIAQAYGLSTTAWQPLGISRTLLAIQANVASQYATTTSFIAQGGYASLAALMVDGDGNPVTEWMDLIAPEIFNVTRIPATQAIGPLPLVNTSGFAYSYSDNEPLHLQNASTGATYTSVGSGSIASSGTTNVQVEADPNDASTGSLGTSGVGTVLVLTTPFAGVTVAPLVLGLVGADAETNSALLTRCQAKLAALSVNGAADAYYFVATSIPQGTPSASPPYAISSVITKADPQLNTGTGTVTLVIANAAGAPNPTDVGVVNAAIQNQVVPNGVTAVVQAATSASVAIAYAVSVKNSAGVTVATIIANIANALSLFFAGIPIGGYNVNQPGLTNYIPYELVAATIMRANPGTVDLALTLNGVIANVTLATTDVAVPAIGVTTVNIV